MAGRGRVEVVYDMARLRGALPNWRLHYLARSRSTNDLAARMRREGRLFAPAIVFTPNQTAGRGRGGNVWYSDSGTLTATFVLPVDEERPAHHLPIMAGLAARDAAAAVLPRDVTVGLKWPNDLLVERRKLAGLLCERVDHVDLVGIGMNVATDLRKAPAELRERVTTLELAGSSPSVTTMLITLAHQLHAGLVARRASFAQTLQRYHGHHYLVGRAVTVRVSGEGEPEQVVEGMCLGMDSLGRLRVEREDGRVEAVLSGQVVGY